MNSAELEAYLHHQIPVTEGLGIEVKDCRDDYVELSAPLSVNFNHKKTAFGGSLSVIGIMAGWSMVFLRCQGIQNEIVIQDSQTKYLKAVTDDFSATSVYKTSSNWEKFYKMLERRGKAKIEVTSEITCKGEVVATHTGVYVAFKV